MGLKQAINNLRELYKRTCPKGFWKAAGLDETIKDHIAENQEDLEEILEEEDDHLGELVNERVFRTSTGMTSGYTFQNELLNCRECGGRPDWTLNRDIGILERFDGMNVLEIQSFYKHWAHHRDVALGEMTVTKERAKELYNKKMKLFHQGRRLHYLGEASLQMKSAWLAVAWRDVCSLLHKDLDPQVFSRYHRNDGLTITKLPFRVELVFLESDQGYRNEPLIETTLWKSNDQEEFRRLKNDTTHNYTLEVPIQEVLEEVLGRLKETRNRYMMEKFDEEPVECS